MDDPKRPDRVLPDNPTHRPLERFWPYAELPEQPTDEELARLHPEIAAVVFGAPTLPFSISLVFPRFEGERYARAVELAAGVLAGDDVVGVLRDRAGDAGAEGFDARLGLGAGEAGEAAGEDEGLAVERAAGAAGLALDQGHAALPARSPDQRVDDLGGGLYRRSHPAAADERWFATTLGPDRVAALAEGCPPSIEQSDVSIRIAADLDVGVSAVCLTGPPAFATALDAAAWWLEAACLVEELIAPLSRPTP